MRLLNMDLNQITRFIGETEYSSEVNDLAGFLSGIELIETALTRNLANTYQGVISMAPGSLHELSRRYLARWDIWNVMLLLRSRKFQIPDSQVRQVFIPAGEISPARIESLLSLKTSGEVVRALEGWELHSVLSEGFSQGYRKGVFAAIENALYLAFYSNLYRDARSGIRGGDAILPYLRFEIDIINIRNIFRLRAGSTLDDIRSYMIRGGNLSPEFFQEMYHVNDRDEFINGMRRTQILPIVVKALQDVRCSQEVCEADAAEVVWSRWRERKTPLFVIVLAVNRMRLHRLDAIARRHPFSVLPILSYLEHKRYEVMNLRAVARGKQFGLEPEYIRKYLVM